MQYFYSRLIKEFDREVKELEHTVDPDTSKMLNEKKQSMVKSPSKFCLSYNTVNTHDCIVLYLIKTFHFSPGQGVEFVRCTEKTVSPKYHVHST